MKALVFGPRVWLRIAIKVTVLLFIFNALFGIFNLTPVITSVNAYGTLAPYRTRLVDPDDIGNQFMPLEVLLKAHEISRPKKDNEFRVIFLGNSGILGAGNPDNATIEAQITASGQTLRGKHIVAYNLAHEASSIMRDFLIADAALAYKPDLIVWCVSLGDFRYDNLNPMIAFNAQRMTMLTQQLGLTGLAAQTYGHFSKTWWNQSFWEQRTVLYRWLRLETYLPVHRYIYQTIAPGIIQQFPVPKEPVLMADDPVFTPMPGPTWDVLTGLTKLTDTPIMIVSEPMYIVQDNPANYNVEFSRALYDQYRTTLSQYCQQHNLWCIDMWDAVPAGEYTDSDFHRTPAGNAIIATKIIQETQSVLGK